MALKKSQLYSSLWSSCDEPRGGMDASQYKDYVLTFLFMKYVTDKYAGDPNALITIPKGVSFNDMVNLKGTKHPGSIEANHAASHPSTPERFVALEDTIKEIKLKQETNRELMPNIDEEALQKRDPPPSQASKIGFGS